MKTDKIMIVSGKRILAARRTMNLFYVDENNILSKDLRENISDSLDLRHIKSVKKDVIHTWYYDENDKEKPHYDFIVDIINVDLLGVSAKERKKLDDKGFDCRIIIHDAKNPYSEVIHFVRYKRSTGSAKSGHCLFINEKIKREMDEWNKCGLTEQDIENNRIYFEAYQALTLSGIQKRTLEIPVKSILVIRDFESCFTDEAISVTLENGIMKAEEKLTEISNSIFDGEGLAEESLFDNVFGNDNPHGMMLLRNRYFKCCVFNTKIQQWFKDHDVNAIQDLNKVCRTRCDDEAKYNSFTLAEKISDIRLIVTFSGIKYLKFGKKVMDWLLNIADERGKTEFGIVKKDHPTKYFEGGMVRSNYQLLNTLDMTEDEIQTLVFPSVDYLKKIHSIPEVFIHHIDKAMKTALKEENYDSVEEYAVYNRDLVTDLTIKNRDFSKNPLYLDLRKQVQDNLLRDYRQGRLLLNGTYATIFGNGYELLCATKNSAHHNFYRGEWEPVIKPGTVYCKRFEDGALLTCQRSPHITMGNLYVAKNVRHDEYDKYFNLTNEIICVNSVNENIQQCLNGMDFDSDTCLITDDAVITDSAMKHYGEFKIPVCCIEPNGSITDISLADYNSSNNNVGRIVNLSQVLNSRLWDKLRNCDNYDFRDDYLEICKLAVLSGIEIDKSKKNYDDVIADDIIKDIEAKYSTSYSYTNKKGEVKTVKEYQVTPLFMKDGFIHRPFNTSMDKLNEVLSRPENRLPMGAPKKEDQANLHISDFLKPHDSIEPYDRKEALKVIEDIEKKYLSYIEQMRMRNSDKVKIHLEMKELIRNGKQQMSAFLDEPRKVYALVSYADELLSQKKELKSTAGKRYYESKKNMTEGMDSSTLKQGASKESKPKNYASTKAMLILYYLTFDEKEIFWSMLKDNPLSKLIPAKPDEKSDVMLYDYDYSYDKSSMVMPEEENPDEILSDEDDYEEYYA